MDEHWLHSLCTSNWPTVIACFRLTEWKQHPGQSLLSESGHFCCTPGVNARHRAAWTAKKCRGGFLPLILSGNTLSCFLPQGSETNEAAFCTHMLAKYLGPSGILWSDPGSLACCRAQWLLWLDEPLVEIYVTISVSNNMFRSCL